MIRWQLLQKSQNQNGWKRFVDTENCLQMPILLVHHNFISDQKSNVCMYLKRLEWLKSINFDYLLKSPHLEKVRYSSWTWFDRVWRKWIKVDHLPDCYWNFVAPSNISHIHLNSNPNNGIQPKSGYTRDYKSESVW